MAVRINDTQDIARSDSRADFASPRAAPLADWLIRLVTALAVATVAAVAAVIS